MTSFPRPALIALAAAQATAPALSRLFQRPATEEEQVIPISGPLTPASGAFAIWGPLFAASIAYPLWRGVPNEPDDRTGDALVATAFGLNVLWSLNTQFRQLGWLSVGLIASSAVAAGTAVERAEQRHPAGELDRARAALIGPLAGWLAVAACANVETAANLRRGRPRPGRETPRAVGILAAGSSLIGVAATRNRGNLPFAAASGWGIGGILIKAVRDRQPAVAATAVLGLGGIAAAVRAGRRTR